MSNDNKITGTYEVSPAAGYAGDVAPTTAWKILSERKDAVLIDVRTRAEWNYVGLPDLEKLAKKPALIEWQGFPSRRVGCSSPRPTSATGPHSRARSPTRRRLCCFSVGVELDRPRRRKP